MKKILFLFLLTQSLCTAQEIVTEPRIQETTTGIKLYLNICNVCPSIKFNQNLEYYWFSETNGIQSSKGKSKGKVIHGNALFYYPNGNLRLNRNYHLGLLNGVQTYWNENGRLIATIKYDMGVQTYFKKVDEDDTSFEEELIGSDSDKIGYENNIYENGLLQLSRINLGDGKEKIFTYYDTGKLNATWTEDSVKKSYGKIRGYHENGEIRLIGNYVDGNRDGAWEYFNEDGSPAEVVMYLGLTVEFRDDKTVSAKGGLYFDSENNEWIKHGTWWFFDEKGLKIIDTKIYEFGTEQKD